MKSVELTEDELQNALDRCNDEVYHSPGRIQQHGYLLVLTETFKIVKCSANTDRVFSTDLEKIVGSQLEAFLPEEKVSELKDLISEGQLSMTRYTHVELPRGKGVISYDAIIHRSNGLLILELEENSWDHAKQGRHDIHNNVMKFSIELQRIQGEQNLYDYLVTQIKELTGFDRVKLYQFDKDWNGEVIAESKETYMSSYLHLHFPSTDIPKQARMLYAKNYLRIIPDANFESVPIFPDDLDQNGEPLDLSFSTLRSVSQVHMQYLKNIDVQASMSISIMQNNQLWGLIACHHKTPYRLSYPLRMAAELMTHTFSAMLSNITHASEGTDLLGRKSSINELAASFAPDDSLIKTLKSKSDIILKSASADGVIVHVDGKHFAFGLIPELHFSDELTRWLEQNYDGEVFVSNSISRDTGLFAKGQSMASGVIAMPVSLSMKDYVIWFRQEHVESKNWAGRPEKNVAEDSVGYYLTPRASFGRWKHEARGYSKEWSSADVEAAREVAKLILNKKYQDSIRKANIDLQSILNNSNALIYIIDLQGNVSNMNQRALEEFNLVFEDIIGRPFEEVFDADLADQIKEHHQKVIQSQESQTFTNDFAIDGKTLHFVSASFPLFDTYGDIHSFCTISTDVSEMKQTQHELERSNKELERMAFIASHDLQEPIRLIHSFTELLKKDYEDVLDDRAQEYINFALDSTSRMKALVQDLLEYSRIGSDTEPYGTIDTGAELKKLLKQYEISDSYKPETIEVNSSMPQIDMKASHFTCIMQNLISNGLKYRSSDREPKINIRCVEENNAWRFSVEDNGIGIEKDYFEKVFMIFQRLHKKGEYEGTGIGLALCSRIVERYHGTIWVSSTPKKGSTFFFTIPKTLNTNS